MKSKLAGGVAISLALGLAGASTAEAANATCVPTEARATLTRVHVKCSASIAGIWYFAYPTSEAQAANRFLTVATTALVSGRTLSVEYDPSDTSGGDFGCLTSDCRKITSLAIR